MSYTCKVCQPNKKFGNKFTFRNHISREHKVSGKFICMKCCTYLDSIGDLRKHQWAEHRESFKALFKTKTQRKQAKSLEKARTARSRKAALRRIEKASSWLALTKVNGASPVVQLEAKKQELTALELLHKLKHQRDFMVDVVNLIEGIVNQ